GEGSAACRDLAADLGVTDRVVMTGALPHNEALRRLSACHILVSPHVQDVDQPFFGSPTKLFEFMALGRPTVASDLEQIGEILNDGHTAVLVEPGNLESFVSGVQRVLALPDKGASIGAAAKLEAEKLHTWDGRSANIIATLESQI
ncbi:MAG: glycosyltransferase, partial [Solirubrobacterales bacterium]|nr:glycosyltransferase [Solirubrobacterales bacterium]